MNEKEFLEALKFYIEDCEDRIEGEWGSGKGVQYLVDNRRMPEVYWEVTKRLYAL